jgi:uncharacterized membrane protein
MDSTQNIEQAFRYLEAASLVLLILKLIGQGLVTRYKAFAVYLAIWLCQDALPLLFGWSLGSDAYARFFFVSEPWAWVFSCLVLLELFDLTFTRFPGIRSAGKVLLTIAILVGVFVGTATAVPTLLYRHDTGGLLLLFSVIERSVMLVTLVLLGTLQYLVLHYRLELPRNTVVYGFTYAVYFTTRALQAFVMSELGAGYSTVANVAAMAVDVGCVLVWAFALTRSGATSQVVAGPKLSDEERARLRKQLASLNEVMGRIRQRQAR